MHQSPLLDLHAELGARVTPPQAGSLVLTYGDVPAEARAGKESALLLDASQRGLVAAEGSDASTFLHRILANHVLPLEPGQRNANLLLTPKGKVQAMFDLRRTATGFEFDCPPGSAAQLLTALDLYLFGEDVTLEDRTEHVAPLELVGAGSGGILQRAFGLEDPPSRAEGINHQTQAGLTVALWPATVAGRAGWRLEAGPEGAPLLWRALIEAGATPGGLVALDSLRADAWAGTWGTDVSEDVYPQEARLEEAFALDKGCYVGQEVVAKIDTYGGLNKQLFLLRVDGDDPVAPGARLVTEEDGEVRDLGQVTSWAWSFEQDAAVILAYVKKRHQEPGTVFRIEGTPMTAVLLRPPSRETD